MTAYVAGAESSAVDDPCGFSDDEGGSRKRVRVSRACEACRRRKERCDGAEPTCQRCRKTGRICTYNPYRKRGLRTGYVRGIEILLGLLIHCYDGAEDLILSVLRGKTHEQPSLSSAYTAAPISVSLLGVWRKSHALQDLQRALVAPESDEDEESYLQNVDHKLTSAFNALPRQGALVRPDTPPDSIAPEPSLLPGSIPRVVSPQPSSPEFALPVALAKDRVNCSIPTLPGNWSRLIDVYICRTHCWLPVIQKYTLLRSANLLASKAGSTHDGGIPAAGDIASLWASLALGSYQLEAVEGSNGTPYHEQNSVQLAPAEIFITAKTLAMQDEPCYDAGHVHASLILSLMEISHGSWTNAWLWVGRAVCLATSLKIVSSATEVLDDAGKRLFLGCFILDTLVALNLGLRPHLNRDDLHHIGDITVDGIEEWEPWRPAFSVPFNSPTRVSDPCGPGRVLSAFNHLASLTGLLSSLYQKSESTPSHARMHIIIDELVQIQRSISTYSSSLFQGSSLQSLEPPHLMQLRILAATIYVKLTIEVARVSALQIPAGALGELCGSSPTGTLELLKSTPKESSIFRIPWSPPTLNILFNLVEQSGASSPEYPLHPDWRNPWLQLSEHAPQDRGVSTVACDRPQTSLMPPYERNAQDIGVAGGEIRAQDLRVGQRLQSAPVPVSNQLPDISNRVGNPQDLVAKQLITNSSIPSPFQPSPLPSQPADGITADVITASGSQVAPTSNALHEPADHDRLFNELTLLETADWPAISGDFMEHLGLSRDGSSFDFETLFS